MVFPDSFGSVLLLTIRYDQTVIAGASADCAAALSRKESSMAQAFINGVFYTMTAEGASVSAVVVEHGRFLYCGDDETAIRMVKDGEKAGIFTSASVTDLKGRCVLPGFIDDHQHVQTYARSLRKADLSGCTSIGEVQKRLRRQAEKLPKGKLLLGTGFDHTAFSEKRLPTRQDLDAVCPDRPAIITRYCLHIHVANSLALSPEYLTAAGIDQKDLETGPDGMPTGLLLEREAAALTDAITGGDDLTHEELLDAIEETLREANSFGITGVHPIQGKMCSLFEQTSLYQELRDAGRLTARIYMGDDEFPGCSIRTGLGDSMVKYGFYKIYTDGSLGGRTALMSEPYSDDPANTGTCHYTQEELDTMIGEAYARHLQTAVHAIGDKAVEMTLLALKKAHDRDPRPWEKVRFRLTHCSLINERIIGLLRDMKLIIDMQPGYVSTNIHWSDDRVGMRAPYLFAWRTLLDLGQLLCGSSDLPCESMNPLVGVYAISTRSGYDGYLPEGWQPQEKLSRFEGVSLYTKNAAFASFEEQEKGTIEVGKLADFAVFDRDIFQVPAEELLKAKVLNTYLGGKEVYSK